jgi:hypothetical protein
VRRPHGTAAPRRPPPKRARLEQLPPSEQANTLLSLVGGGSTHVATVHQVAVSSMADHGPGTAAAVQALGSLGAGGRCPQNLERDLHRWVRDLWGYGLHLDEVLIRAQVDGGHEASLVTVPVLGMHTVIQAVLRAGYHQIATSILGPECSAGFDAFWTTALQEPWCSHLERDLQDRNKGRTIPMVFHEDGAEMYRNSEFYVWSWRSASPGLTSHERSAVHPGDRGAEVFRNSDCYVGPGGELAWPYKSQAIRGGSGSQQRNAEPPRCRPAAEFKTLATGCSARTKGEERPRGQSKINFGTVPPVPCTSESLEHAPRGHGSSRSLVRHSPGQSPVRARSGADVGDVTDSQFPIALVPHRWLPSVDLRIGAHNAIVKYIAACLEKLRPNCLADGWSGLFFAWTGDLKARREAHRFSASYQHTNVCDTCCAQQATQSATPSLLYQDFRDTAAHRRTRITQETYLLANAGRLSPWTQVRGWTLNLTLLDAMHVVFLGIGRDHVASHLVAWCELGLLQHGRRPTRASLRLARHMSSPRKDLEACNGERHVCPDRTFPAESHAQSSKGSGRRTKIITTAPGHVLRHAATPIDHMPGII